MRIFLICFLLIQFSCTEEPFYSETQKIPVPWPYEQEIEFYVDIVDTSSLYTMELLINHAGAYKYENIYFRVKTDFPSIEDREELLNVELASKAGQWMGKCNAKSCKVKVYMLDRFKFPEPGRYGFLFEQYTREQRLEGIETMDLIIAKMKNESN
jgi:gliding motility-associated lipoprotein GldH